MPSCASGTPPSLRSTGLTLWFQAQAAQQNHLRTFRKLLLPGSTSASGSVRVEPRYSIFSKLPRDANHVMPMRDQQGMLPHGMVFHQDS